MSGESVLEMRVGLLLLEGVVGVSVYPVCATGVSALSIYISMTLDHAPVL